MGLPALSPSCSAQTLYRPRDPQSTPLYLLLDSLYEKVKAVWEDRFERRYGFWRGFVDTAVARYLDCGIFENGFARVKCKQCPSEFLVALSCKVRGLCPSCGAKRAAAFAAFLKDELLEEVGHALWSFTLPKMLRPYFLNHRELLGELCQAAYETVHELMVAAVEEEDFRPGMVALIQTFADSLRWNPHIHALATRGGWTAEGQWVPVPYIDSHAAELLFRHKVIRLLKDKGLLSDERINLLLSWKNHTGFSVDNSVTVYPNDETGLESVARYMLRSPVSLQRLHFLPDTQQVLYQAKRGEERNTLEPIDPMEFVARVLIHIPDPNKHSVHYFGHYASAARALRKTTEAEVSHETTPCSDEQTDSTSPSTPIAALRRSWRYLIRRVYQVDPLVCPRCGGEMRVISFITKPKLIRTILDHLKKRDPKSRAPPNSEPESVSLPL